MTIDEMQMGFIPGKETINAIFVTRQIQVKFKTRINSYTMLL